VSELVSNVGEQHVSASTGIMVENTNPRTADFSHEFERLREEAEEE
jgi:hypothetical protein